MGLFSNKKNNDEKENTSSQQELDAIQLSTLDYIPGYKVVKSLGIVSTWNTSDRPINNGNDSLKETAIRIYPGCNAIIGCVPGISAVAHSGYEKDYFCYYISGTAVIIEPEN